MAKFFKRTSAEKRLIAFKKTFTDDTHCNNANLTQIGNKRVMMKLNDEERAMRHGDCGPAKQWAINHQIQVGSFFDAVDMVLVRQAHMMADPESVGEAGVTFVEGLASSSSQVVIPMITDPRGVDLSYYQPLGQTEDMASLERRFIAHARPSAL